MEATPVLLGHLKDAVRAMEASWDAQRDFEIAAGHDFDGMGELVEDFAVAGAEGITLQDVQDFLDSADLDE